MEKDLQQLTEQFLIDYANRVTHRLCEGAWHYRFYSCAEVDKALTDYAQGLSEDLAHEAALLQEENQRLLQYISERTVYEQATGVGLILP